jgi:hypothetical protein
VRAGRIHKAGIRALSTFSLICRDREEAYRRRLLPSLVNILGDWVL